MRVLDLFSGVGGFSLAARWAGWETVAFCEREPFCQKVLTKHWPGVPIHDDITTLDGTQYRGAVDLICGGFPCQPFSGAGKRGGTTDDRYLWPEMLRVIDEVEPSLVVGENVDGILSLGIDSIISDLETAGFDVQPLIIPACAVNAPHRRNRVWILADSNRRGFKGVIPRIVPRERKPTQAFSLFPIRAGDALPDDLPKPLLLGGDDGLPDRVDRTRALGNAIVPQVAYEIFRAINEVILLQQSAR